MKRIAIGLVFILSACAGTDTGNPLHDGDGGPRLEGATGLAPNCEETERELAFSEMTPLGFSAEELVDTIGGEHTTTLSWLPPQSISYGPEMGESALSLTVEALGSAAYVMRSPAQGNESDGTEEIADVCEDSVVVDATLGLRTEGGAFDETVQVRLDGRSVDAATTSFTLPVGELNGSFMLSFESQPGFDLESPPALNVSILLSELGVSGSFWSFLQFKSTDAESTDALAEAAGQEIAHFPAVGYCGPDSVRVNGDQVVRGLSMTSVIEALTEPGPFSLSYDDGTPDTEITLELSPFEDTLCVQVVSDFGAPRGLEFPATAAIVTADGQVDGSFEVNVFAESDEDHQLALAQASGGRFEWDATLALGLAEQFGIKAPISLDGYSGAAVDFLSKVQPDGVGGSFRFYGLEQADCAAEPLPDEPAELPAGEGMGSPGCVGTLQTQLWGAHWGTLPVEF